MKFLFKKLKNYDRFLRNHEFTRLKFANISMNFKIIKTSDFTKFKGSWRSASELGLKKFSKRSIYFGRVGRDEVVIFGKPKFLSEAKDEILGAKIIGFSANFGTYGMGSPGFFALKFDNQKSLIFSVYFAEKHTFVDDKVVGLPPRFYDKIRPLVSNFSDKKWDDLSEIIVGGTICEIVFKDDEILICFIKNDQKHTIKFSRLNPNFKEISPAYEIGTISDFTLVCDGDSDLICDD